MVDTVLRREELSTTTLRSVFEAAFLSTEMDTDGHLIVRDGYPCFVVPEANGTRVHVLAFAGVREESTWPARLRLANRVNDTLSLIRAAVTAAGGLCFDTYVVTDAGIPERSLVNAVRTFTELMRLLASLDEEKVLG